ncbi:TPA: hypothetical protein ACH3X1_011931 [Trebouxia sp. C0004]
MDQERKAICQALSREVGRMHRKTACRSDGNTARQCHSWDEAFAQVMLAQQESIAQLMSLYEAVRSQIEEELQQVLGQGYGQHDHQLDALHQEHALGQAHMKQDREGLIQELRGSMYSLLDAFKGDYTQQAMHYEQRILHLQNTLHAQLASSFPVQAVSDKQPGLQDDLQYGQMAYAAYDASDDDGGRSRGTSRSRSRTRSRKQTPEPLLRSPALSGKTQALLKTPVRGAVAAKSPRAAVVNPSTAVVSVRTVADVPRAVSKSPRPAQQGSTSASISPRATGTIQDAEYRPGHLGSISRLQRLRHRDSSSMQMNSASGLAVGTAASDAAHRASQGARSAISQGTTSSSMPSPAGILRRSKSSMLAQDMLRTKAGQELEGMHQQLARAASTPPGAMLSDQQTPSQPPQQQHQVEVSCRQPTHHLPATALQQHALHTAGSELMHPVHGPADLQLHQRQPKHHQTLQLHLSFKESGPKVQTSMLEKHDAWPPAQQHGHAHFAGYHAQNGHQPTLDVSATLGFQPQSAACTKPDAPPQMQAAEHAQPQGQSVRLDSNDAAMLPAAAQLMPFRHVGQQHGHVLLHMANRGAGQPAQGELEHDECLKVQKLAVTPHKLSSRQLSGNPFAEASSTDSHQPDVGIGQQPMHLAESEQQPSQPQQALLHAVHSPKHTHQAHMPLAVSHVTRHVARPTDEPQQTAQLDQQLNHKQQPSQGFGSMAELSQQTSQPARPVGHGSPSAAPVERAASAQSGIPPVRQGNKADVGPSLAAVARESNADLNHSQLSRSLLESLEQEAVAADEEACLQELQFLAGKEQRA